MGTDIDRAALVELANYRMPFGKYKGTRLVELPEPYVVWFKQKGFPEGKLGRLLREVYEIKVNGLEDLLRPLMTPGKDQDDGKPGSSRERAVRRRPYRRRG
jgi:uncharacterized protein (DUF3820 family)